MKPQRKQPTKKEMIQQAMLLLDDVNKNIRLFKKTRQEVRKQYPKLFPSAQ